MPTKPNIPSPRAKAAHRSVNHQTQRVSGRHSGLSANGDSSPALYRLEPKFRKTEVQNKTKTERSRRATARHLVHFELVNTVARKVCLAGSFNNWKPEDGQMARLGDGKWSKDLALAPGIYEYRLVIDGEWIPDPRADHTVVNPFGERNSLLTVS
jgi:hypothetical protein